MSKYLVETFYTCTFKIVHKLDELNEKKLSDLENKNDGKVEIIDVKLNKRKTKTVNNKEGVNVPNKNTEVKVENKILFLLSFFLSILTLFNNIFISVLFDFFGYSCVSNVIH